MKSLYYQARKHAMKFTWNALARAFLAFGRALSFGASIVVDAPKGLPAAGDVTGVPVTAGHIGANAGTLIPREVK